MTSRWKWIEVVEFCEGETVIVRSAEVEAVVIGVIITDDIWYFVKFEPGSVYSDEYGYTQGLKWVSSGEIRKKKESVTFAEWIKDFFRD